MRLRGKRIEDVWWTDLGQLVEERAHVRGEAGAAQGA